MKKIGTYWKVYIGLIALLVVVGVILAVYTKNSLQTYEKSQPEKVVISEMTKVQNAAKYRTLNVIMDMSMYEKEAVEKYYELMNNAKTWKCKAISGGYSDTAQVWGIFADDTLVASVNLSGSNTRTQLLILTATDWKVTGLNCGLGQLVSNDPGPTSGPIYVTKYEYDLTLPATYTVISENMTVKGTDLENNQKHYKFLTTDEIIRIKDEYGCEVKYKHGESLSGHNITVKIPDVYTITLKDTDLSKYALEEKEDIEALKVCYDFGKNLPKLTVYQLDDALTHPEFEIKDQNGQKVEYRYEGDTITINNLAKTDTIPEEITSVTDLMSIAEKWSLLMTRDLGVKDERYGFNKIKAYIVKDSPLLAIASNYINSDIWTISNHKLQDPPFKDESVSGYVRYSDDIFAVDVKLTKVMLVRNVTETRYDTISNTIFFIRNTGNGEPWLMVDMMSNLEK